MEPHRDIAVIVTVKGISAYYSVAAILLINTLLSSLLVFQTIFVYSALGGVITITIYAFFDDY